MHDYCKKNASYGACKVENSKILPDKTDRTILREIQKDGRISNVELARRVNLSESACLRRVRALEDAGVIDGYVGLVNPAMAGLSGNVFVRITLQRQQQKDLEDFERAVSRVPEVMECYLMTGDSDYLLRVIVANAADFERLHYQQLTRLPGVARVQSSFALRTVVKRTAIPID